MPTNPAPKPDVRSSAIEVSLVPAKSNLACLSSRSNFLLSSSGLKLNKRPEPNSDSRFLFIRRAISSLVEPGGMSKVSVDPSARYTVWTGTLSSHTKYLLGAYRSFTCACKASLNPFNYGVFCIKHAHLI